MREELHNGILRLTLDRPDRLNAFTGTAYRDLRIAVERATTDTDVRGVILTGEGRAFSAGADRSLVDGTAPAEERTLAGEEFSALLRALGRCDAPVLVAVNGLAVGIGTTLLLHCDLVLAAESARFRLPFTSLGVVPEAGSSVLMPARARWADTVWAMLSSEWIDAAAAHAMGLVWRVVPDTDLQAEADRVMATIAALDPAAVRATKRLLLEGREAAVEVAVAREFAVFGMLLSGRAGQ